MASRGVDLSMLIVAGFLMVQSSFAAYGVRLVRDLVGTGQASVLAVAAAHQSSDSADVK